MPRKHLAVLVTASFTITGCSASEDAPEVAAPAEAEAEATDPATEEFASIIAEGRRDVDEWLET